MMSCSNCLDAATWRAVNQSGRCLHHRRKSRFWRCQRTTKRRTGELCKNQMTRNARERKSTNYWRHMTKKISKYVSDKCYRPWTNDVSHAAADERTRTGCMATISICGRSTNCPNHRQPQSRADWRASCDYETLTESAANAPLYTGRGAGHVEMNWRAAAIEFVRRQQNVACQPQQHWWQLFSAAGPQLSFSFVTSSVISPALNSKWFPARTTQLLLLRRHCRSSSNFIFFFWWSELWIMELGGRVVRVLDSGQLHQSERSWVRFLDGPLKKNCQASGQSRGHVSSGWTRKNTID